MIRVALLLTGLLAGLVLCESASQLLRPSMPERFTVPIQVRTAGDKLWRSRPGGTGEYAGGPFTFDGAGFRTGRSGAYDYTVLFIGDSFTFGYGIGDDETFPAFVQHRLMELGIRARCLNAGQIQFGTAEELRVMKMLLGTYAIDAVVFQVLPENDLEDNWEDGGFGLDDGRLISFDPPQKPLRMRIREWIADTSHEWDSAALAALSQVAYRRGWFRSPMSDDQYALEGALLREVSATLDQAEIALLMFAVPTDPTSRDIAPGSKYGRVQQLIAASGAPFVELAPQLDKVSHYIISHGHFSPAGNAVGGRVIAERLAPMLQARKPNRES